MGSASPAVARVGIPSLKIAISIEFQSRKARSLMRSAASGHASGARLPPHEWTDLDDGPDSPSAAVVRIGALPRGSKILLRYDSRHGTAQYTAERSGIHWDFWRIVLAAASGELLANDVITLHAAAIDADGGVILLPGSSGAGKSSVAFAALDRGGTVYSSELAFCREARLISGNALMTIDGAAADRLNIVLPAAARDLDGRRAVPASPISAPRPITRIVFPRVTPSGRVFVRRISARRSRMLLFENAVGELPVGKLVMEESVPLGTVTREEVEVVAEQVRRLASVGEALIVEGAPNEIARYLLSPE